MLGRLPARVHALLQANTGRSWASKNNRILVPRRDRSALTGTASHTREALGVPSVRSSAVANFESLPHPRGLPVVGTTLSLLMAGSSPQLHRYCDARHAQLGPVYREAIGPVDCVFVADPVEMRRVHQYEGRYPRHLLPDAWMLYNELYGCKRGLFFMDGEEWLDFRRIMNKLMLKNDAADEFLEPCNQVVDKLVNSWRSHSNDEVPNLESQIYKWSLDILVAVLVGNESYKKNNTKINASPTLKRLSAEVQLVFQESARLSLLPARLARALHLPVWGRFERAVDRALHGASSLVLELLPMARGGDGLLEKMLAQGIELRDLVPLVADMILAAGDTTAYTAQWTLYLLAKHSEEQEAARHELLSQPEGENTSLVRGILREAMRLYPVAPFVTRLLPDDCEIAGYNVPAGNLILLSYYTSGRSASNFPDPNRFWPERWLRINGTPSSTNAFRGVYNAFGSMPFAFGARSCIGRKLAQTQLTQLISKLLQEYKIELVQPEREVQMVLRMVSVPSEPIRLRITPRKN